MGKPLISDATMRGMYNTMQQMRLAKRNPATVEPLPRSERAALQLLPESLLAALLSQLHRRDTILTQGTNPLLPVALRGNFGDGPVPPVETCTGTPEECSAVAAGMALRATRKRKSVSREGNDVGMAPQPVVIALLHSLPSLTGVLEIIEERDLSVLLVAGGEAESRADAQRRLLSTRVPVMQVDSADAVAVCRVAQECLLRARNGWGGALIHATAMAGARDPIVLLQDHLKKRGLIPQDA